MIFLKKELKSYENINKDIQPRNIIKSPLLPVLYHLRYNLISPFIQLSYMKLILFAYSWILMKT